MPAQKRVKAVANAVNQLVDVPAAADPGKGLLTLNVFDGTRQPIAQGTKLLVTITDGLQNRLYSDYLTNATTVFSLPFHDNLADNYSVVVSADGYRQAGFQPVRTTPPKPRSLDIMLLPNNGKFTFAQAGWSDVKAKRPLLAQIFAASAPSDAGTAYAKLMQNHPDQLACLLNITTAMQQISLPHGSPLDYFKEFNLDALASDRIFGYADPALVQEVKAAASQDEFSTEPAIDLLLHPGSTSSYKQIQFGEANVQLTFHENAVDRKTIDGLDCVYVEPDIDYYKDPGAHLILEVLPNQITHMVSDPSMVYVLRWMAGQRAGIPNFDPLYTIE